MAKSERYEDLNAQIFSSIDQYGLKWGIGYYQKGEWHLLTRRNLSYEFREYEDAERMFNKLMDERKREDEAIPFTMDEAQAFIDKWQCKKIFAKTYANTCPHSYYMKNYFPSYAWPDFERFVATCKKYQEDGRFYGTKRKYFILGKEYYWDITLNNLSVNLINCAGIESLEIRDGMLYYKGDKR